MHSTVLQQHTRSPLNNCMITTTAFILLFPMTFGVVMGIWSSLRADIPFADVMHDSRGWLTLWSILVLVTALG